MLYGLSVLFSHSGIPHTDAECEWFLCVWYRSVKREHREKNYIYVLFIRIKYLIFSLLFDLVSITVLFKSPVCVCVYVFWVSLCACVLFFLWSFTNDACYLFMAYFISNPRPDHSAFIGHIVRVVYFSFYLVLAPLSLSLFLSCTLLYTRLDFFNVRLLSAVNAWKTT